MAFLVDTHTFVWFLTEDKKLSKKVSEILQMAEKGEETIIIPTIVLAEIMYICEKKKIGLYFKDIIEKLKDSVNYIVCDLDLDTIIKANEIDNIIELHDRIIVASAMLTDSKILTKDENIGRSDYVETIW